jgi:hypothetical protein
MAHFVSAASGARHVAQVQQAQKLSEKPAKSANNAKSGPEDTVSISSAGRVAQKPAQTGGKE